jgi:hypothetical protein
MSPETALSDLLLRVGANGGAAVFISSAELEQWPDAAVMNMKLQNLLTKARPAVSVVCPGCDRHCTMPVRTASTGDAHKSSFVVCDKRSDINRVPVSGDQLVQWRCDAHAVCNFIATTLGFAAAAKTRGSEPWQIGIASGGKRRQMLCLRADGHLHLVAGDASLPLTEAVRYRDGAYSIDSVVIRQLVDSSKTGDARYTPSTARREAGKLTTQENYRRWKRAYRVSVQRHPDKSDVWHSREIAKRDPSGRGADTIRKHMKG